jgi:hypothetical protein
MEKEEDEEKGKKAAVKKLHIHVMLDRKAMKGNFYVLETKKKSQKNIKHLK